MDSELIAAKYYKRFTEYFKTNSYSYDEEISADGNRVIRTKFSGDDLQMELRLIFNAEKERVSLFSQMPFHVAEDKRFEAAVACNAINYKLAVGSFDYNHKDGTVLFRLTHLFEDGNMPDETIHSLLGLALNAIDNYNDKLLAISSGALSLEEFLKKML